MIENISANTLLSEMSRLQNSIRMDRGPATAKGTPQTEAPDFGEMLNNLVSEVDQAQKASDTSIRSLAAGEATSIQDVVMKMENADLSFRMMKEIRDKLMTAYKDILSIQA